MEKTDSFLQASSTTLQYLEKLGIQFETVDDNEDDWLIIGLLSSEIGNIRIFVSLRREPAHILVYAYHPLVVLPSMRNIAAEFFLRANYGLPIGNFEMDMEDGEVRFKASLDFTNTPLSQTLVSGLVETALGSLAIYHTPLVHVLYDGMEPQIAIHEAEKNMEE